MQSIDLTHHCLRTPEGNQRQGYLRNCFDVGAGADTCVAVNEAPDE